MERVTKKYLIEKGFQEDKDVIGWTKFHKNNLELVEIPLKNGLFVIGFGYEIKGQMKYKYPITIDELNQLYKILTGLEL